MSKEALKMALEALDNLMYWDNGKSDYDQARQAITALETELAKPDFWEGYVPEPTVKQSLTVDQPAQQCRRELSADGSFVCDCKPAQQEQSCYCPNCEVMSKELAELKKHKPVAWMDADGNFSDNNDHKCFPIPLYTISHPTPAQRTWVSLTDEEISETALNNPPMVHELARAIEAKLRSKNA